MFGLVSRKKYDELKKKCSETKADLEQDVFNVERDLEVFKNINRINKNTANDLYDVLRSIVRRIDYQERKVRPISKLSDVFVDGSVLVRYRRDIQKALGEKDES